MNEGGGVKEDRAPSSGAVERASRPRRHLGGRVLLMISPFADDRRPVIVFHHIRKTAGTSLTDVLKRQLADMDRHNAWAPHSHGHPPTRDVGGWYANLWRALGGYGRARLGCVCSHSANYLLPLVDQPVVAISLVREPVDRVLSRYHFSKRKVGAADRPQGKSPFRQIIGSTSLEGIYERYANDSSAMSPEHRAFAQFFNGQARSLLDPLVDTSELAFTAGPPPEADMWRRHLAEAVASYAWIGVQDRFDEFVAGLCEGFGWQLAEQPRAKVNAHRPQNSRRDIENAEMIRSFNWLDEELYRQCAGAFSSGPATLQLRSNRRFEAAAAVATPSAAVSLGDA
jgi:hypothetical protein